jgi:flavin reductase (DIM6/NTAB) family NADH-FMN oxidoreductase RutF
MVRTDFHEETLMAVTPQSVTPVDSRDFRGAMGAVATPVSVVTAMLEEPHGTTVSAFCSLSLDPPMVLVSLQGDSDLLAIIRRTRRFGLNVLAHGQSAIGAVFARRGVDRFAGVPWGLSCGLPRLAGVASWAACEVADLIVAGDHVIVTGLTQEADHHDKPGLVYQHRRFGAFVADAAA